MKSIFVQGNSGSKFWDINLLTTKPTDSEQGKTASQALLTFQKSIISYSSFWDMYVFDKICQNNKYVVQK